MGLHCKLVPVQYREYDINLFLMIFAHMSLHCKLVPVQYREYDINLFLMILELACNVGSCREISLKEINVIFSVLDYSLA